MRLYAQIMQKVLMMYDKELNVTLASMCENLLTMAAQPSAAGHSNFQSVRFSDDTIVGSQPFHVLRSGMKRQQP